MASITRDCIENILWLRHEFKSHTICPSLDDIRRQSVVAPGDLGDSQSSVDLTLWEILIFYDHLFSCQPSSIECGVGSSHRAPLMATRLLTATVEASCWNLGSRVCTLSSLMLPEEGGNSFGRTALAQGVVLILYLSCFVVKVLELWRIKVLLDNCYRNQRYQWRQIDMQW